MTTEVGASSAVSSRRKRALQAIERTYGVKKPGISEQQDKYKMACQGDEKDRRKDKQASVATATPNPAFRRGEKSHSAYGYLSQSVHENLVRPQSQFSNEGNPVDVIIRDLLQNGDSAHKYVQGSRSMRIDDWLLLDNFVPARKALQDARVMASQNPSKRSRKRMSMRQHRACGSFEIPPEYSKFEFFKPMHEMWKEHVLKLMKESGKHQLNHVLLTADLHGAIIQVVECKSIGLTGRSGIMIRETEETFGIIMQNDKFQVIPKKGSVFQFRAGTCKVTLFGDELSVRKMIHNSGHS